VPAAIPQSPRPPPPPGYAGTRQTQARKAKFTGRDKGATRSLPVRGETPQPFSPRTPLPARGRSAPRKVHPVGNGALPRSHRKRRATLTAASYPPSRDVPRCKTGTAAPLPIHREKAAPPPGDRAQPPRTPRSAPGQSPEREPRHCMPRFCSKRMPLPGAGLLVGWSRVFADLTPSASGESEVGKNSKHSNPPTTQSQNQKQ